MRLPSSVTRWNSIWRMKEERKKGSEILFHSSKTNRCSSASPVCVCVCVCVCMSMCVRFIYMILILYLYFLCGEQCLLCTNVFDNFILSNYSSRSYFLRQRGFTTWDKSKQNVVVMWWGHIGVGKAPFSYRKGDSSANWFINIHNFDEFVYVGRGSFGRVEVQLYHGMFVAVKHFLSRTVT